MEQDNQLLLKDTEPGQTFTIDGKKYLRPWVDPDINEYLNGTEDLWVVDLEESHIKPMHVWTEIDDVGT